MVDSPLRPGTAVVVSTEGGVEYPGVLAAFNDDVVMIEIKKRSATFRPGSAVTLEFGGRAYESSVARIDGAWVTLARPAALAGTAARGAVRLAVKALPVVATYAGQRAEGHVVDVSASGARLSIAGADHFVVDATLKLAFRSTSGTTRIRRVDAAARVADDGDGTVQLGLTFEADATELHRQLIRAMGGIRSDS